MYKKRLLHPPRLRPGDTIGIVAPAGPFDTELFDRGIEVLKSFGFRVHWPKNIFKKIGYLAGPDKHRANQVNRLFLNPEIKAIICARGGFGSMKTLSSLNLDLIRKNPKIFMGFSDISALLSVFYLHCGLVTFHGPVVTTLGKSTQKTKDTVLNVLSSDKNPELKPEKGVTIKPGSASGPILGGNLTTLCHLMGTPYEPCFKDHILLLEDTGEATYRIDRMLIQMKLAGCLEGLKGVVLGSFKKCGDLVEIFRIVEERFSVDEIPILGGFEIGHGRTNITIPLGIEATLDADAKIIRFHEPATVNP